MNGTASIPGWYVEFQANVLRQLPRTGEIDSTTAEGWNRNQKALKNVLAGALLPSKEMHLINCDADPFVPSDWKVEEHKKGGQFAFNPAKVKFYLSPNQQDGKRIEGNKLRKELENKPILNANVLDYLLAHPELIPEDWKEDEKGDTRFIFFWGTIYRNSRGGLYVRFLYWGDGSWYWGFYWLDNDWDGVDPAVAPAS